MTWTKQTSTSTAFSKQNPTSTTWGIRRSGRYKYGDRLKFAGDPSGARYHYGGDSPGSAVSHQSGDSKLDDAGEVGN